MRVGGSDPASRSLASACRRCVARFGATRARPDRAARFGFGKPATAAEIAGLGHRRAPRRQGTAGGTRQRRAGPGDLRREMRELSRNVRRKHRLHADRRRRRHACHATSRSARPAASSTTPRRCGTTSIARCRSAIRRRLSPDEVYALTAYVLHLNDILPADAALDRESIVKVRMPNRDGFTTDHGLAARSPASPIRATSPACATACARCGCPRRCRTTRATTMAISPSRRGRSVPPTEPSERPPERRRRRRPEARGELAKTAGCTACHGMTQKIVGPAFREIGGRYAGDGSAADRLAVRVRQGSSGSWGGGPDAAAASVERAGCEGAGALDPGRIEVAPVRS